MLECGPKQLKGGGSENLDLGGKGGKGGGNN